MHNSSKETIGSPIPTSPASPSVDAVPRLVVAGLSGDSGKTIVSLGLALTAGERGVPVQAFKKGPDYIDAAWLRWASGRPARNLDTFLMGRAAAARSFRRHALPDGLNLVEGNRGLYDGADERGTHSTAELAKALQAPVVLVLNTTKMTRTAAACVLGCQKLDPEVDLAAVVLNEIGSPRQERLIRAAIEEACGVPVVGAIPRAKGDTPLPERHLGLVPPQEHQATGGLRQALLGLVRNRLDFGRLLDIARAARPLPRAAASTLPPAGPARPRIGYLWDAAFTFYYPENLEALTDAGAELAPISALGASELPADLHALYIGGGFPETHAAVLAANQTFLGSLRQAAAAGLPIYAECGGLMLLSRAIRWRGERHQMAGILPFEVEVCEKPQGHGYCRLEVDTPNPFYPLRTAISGHEFHYSRIVPQDPPAPTAAAVTRGSGSYPGRDGVLAYQVWASYTHVHALGAPEWASGLLDAARRRLHLCVP